MKKYFTVIIALSLLISSWAGAQDKAVKPFSPEFYKLYKQAALYFNPNLSSRQVEEIVKSVVYYSYYYELDARLVMAVIACESSFDPDATSAAGAAGLGQIMPANAASHAINAYDPVQNINVTVRLLRTNLDRFACLPRQQQYENALAAYNAGYGAVLKYGGVPPYSETYNYVYKVITLWRRFCGLK
jgi:soluble lytic murein transglycosylase-like protein